MVVFWSHVELIARKRASFVYIVFESGWWINIYWSLNSFFSVRLWKVPIATVAELNDSSRHSADVSDSGLSNSLCLYNSWFGSICFNKWKFEFAAFSSLCMEECILVRSPVLLFELISLWWFCSSFITLMIYLLFVIITPIPGPPIINGMITSLPLLVRSLIYGTITGWCEILSFPPPPIILTESLKKCKPSTCICSNRSQPVSTYGWGNDTVVSVRFNPGEPDILATSGRYAL